MSAPYQIFNRLVDFYDIQQGGHAIEGNRGAIICNPVASTVPKWRTLRILRWMQILHKSMWNHRNVYVRRSSKDEQILIRLIL
jgi:hypothetical protein